MLRSSLRKSPPGFFGEDPVFIPKERPEGEKDSGDEETDVWRNAEPDKAADKCVVHNKTDGFYKYVAAGVLHFAERDVVAKRPEPLHQIVCRPADGIR